MSQRSEGNRMNQFQHHGARGETGWEDKKGKVWVPDRGMHGGEGWRVHMLFTLIQEYSQ